MRKTLLSLTVLTCFLLASACQIYEPGQRAYISDYRYDTVQEIYDTTGSLELTRESLREDPTWSQPEINEAIYRLKKQYQLENVKAAE